MPGSGGFALPHRPFRSTTTKSENLSPDTKNEPPAAQLFTDQHDSEVPPEQSFGLPCSVSSFLVAVSGLAPGPVTVLGDRTGG
jgi:hypothetical protein